MVTQHPYGFYHISPLPTNEFLNDYYSGKYYQKHPSSTYQAEYTAKEMLQIEHQSLLIDYVLKNVLKKDLKNALDLGCGEGFVSRYLHEKDYEVTLCDHSSYGIAKFNNHLLDFFTQGDVYSVLEKKAVYDFINFKNVLEHVLDPVDVLLKIKKLMHKDSILRIQVPNDFSSYQKMLNKEYNVPEYFVSPPDHLSYFNSHSLLNTLEKCGYKVDLQHGDFPIEIFLANPSSNYVTNKEMNGKNAHNARVDIDNFIFDKGYDVYLSYMMASAKADIARSLIFYCHVT